LLRSFLTLASLALILVLLGACSGLNDNGTHEDFVQTQTASQPDEEGGHGGEGDEGEGEGTPEPDGEASPDTGGGGGDLAATGQELSTSYGCTGCHSIDGSQGVGPTWQGLFGHEVALDNGQTVTANEEYITVSIRDPSAQIVEGFQDLMPKTYADLPDDEIAAIVAYIQSLE
jgi:cytochrome c oxidase subunit 2